MMRTDGRQANELRKVEIIVHYLKTAPASVLISAGRTQVLCVATYEGRVPQFLKGTGQGWVRSEYGMLPCSSTQRIPREAVRGKQSGRTLEIQRMIGRALRQALDLRYLGEITITLDCDVIQADGGTRTLAITGGFIALAELIKQLNAEGKFSTLPIKNFVAAVSVGIVNGTPVLDLNYEEDSNAEVDINLVMTQENRIVELQGTVEKGNPITLVELEQLIKLGADGIKQLISLQKQILGNIEITP